MRNIRNVCIYILLICSLIGVVVSVVLFVKGLTDSKDEKTVEGKSIDRENSLGGLSEEEKRRSDSAIDLYLPDENNNGPQPPDEGSDVVGEPPPVIPPVTSSVDWGAYTGWRVSDTQNFRSTVGVEMQYLAVFVHWGNENEFPDEIAQYARSQGMTLVIYWEAMDYDYPTPSDPRFSYDAIIRGDWDQYILSFANSVGVYGSPVILVLFEEMNSDWYPWSGTINGNTATKHILAFRHVRDIFRYTENAKFGWTVNNDSVPDTPANSRLNYYPGDNYVDYVGVDGFNFGSPWQTFSQVFDRALDEVSSIGKPVIIFSMACRDGAQKAEWIRDAFQVQLSLHQNVVGWIWFNENKERDWRVWSDTASLQAFQESVAP